MLLLGGCNQLASTTANVEGVRAYQTGNYEAARQRFNEALASDPGGADSYYNLAATYHRLGKLQNNPADLKQAEGLYNQCLDRNPNHTDCYRSLAVLLVDTGRPDAAVRLLEGWGVKNPTRADPKIETARVLEELGDREKAVERLHAALTVEPNNARALTALGRLREESGDLAQALTNYQRSLAVNRFQPHVLARVAVLQATVGGAAPVGSSTPAGQTRVVDQPQRSNRY
jgi:tetratricopeptide (TPR) repeat protein